MMSKFPLISYPADINGVCLYLFSSIEPIAVCQTIFNLSKVIQIIAVSVLILIFQHVGAFDKSFFSIISWKYGFMRRDSVSYLRSVMHFNGPCNFGNDSFPFKNYSQNDFGDSYIVLQPWLYCLKWSIERVVAPRGLAPFLGHT